MQSARVVSGLNPIDTDTHQAFGVRLWNLESLFSHRLPWQREPLQELHASLLAAVENFVLSQLLLTVDKLYTVKQ